MPARALARGSRTAAADVRLVRAFVLASVSLTLAAAAHTMAGGQVGTGPLLLGWALTAVVGAFGAGRQRSLPEITGMFSAGQLGLHLLFQASPVVPPPGRAKPPTAPGGHLHMHHPAAVTGGGAVHAAAHGGALGHSPAMLAAHACATLATGWLLHHVETVLWHLMDLARALPESARDWRRRFRDTLARLVGQDAPVRPQGTLRTGPAPSAEGVRCGPVVLRHTLVLRGPPRVVNA
ncbi:hypothetical protein [Kitasatospora sp. NPDC097691]|uniref:hypothetical protein n=1 Tax=Kitasatospora sp. NPDC097691 TaxID=3157231 RepID=UPI00332F94B8